MHGLRLTKINFSFLGGCWLAGTSWEALARAHWRLGSVERLTLGSLQGTLLHSKSFPGLGGRHHHLPQAVSLPGQGLSGWSSFWGLRTQVGETGVQGTDQLGLLKQGTKAGMGGGGWTGWEAAEACFLLTQGHWMQKPGHPSRNLGLHQALAADLGWIPSRASGARSVTHFTHSTERRRRLARSHVFRFQNPKRPPRLASNAPGHSPARRRGTSGTETPGGGA